MKKYSLKFWIIFWTCSGLFLLGWFLFWNYKNEGVGVAISDAVGFFPIGEIQKKEYQALATFGDFFLNTDGKEKTLLVLFQNNLEIRPGGGFIGAFAIVKLNNGKIVSMETHDLSNFDGRIPNTVEPPYPMKETLHIDAWKLRDSNYSPDFATNAQKAEEFYYMGGGGEKFDGVIGITANMLTSILKITGPIQIEGYPGTYESENAIVSLEYQVEKAFEEQGIDRGDRKSVMNDLGKEIEKRVFAFSTSQKIQLAKVLVEDLNKKDIQLYFEDSNMQQKAVDASWAGKVDQEWNKDYLMAVDANLGSFKSDYYVKRSMDYTLDLTSEIPTVQLKISYEHTAKQKDWMTRDYVSYLRTYVPEGAWLTDSKNFDNTKFGNELGKKYFGAIIRVPIGTSKTIEINYTLPKTAVEDYALKIQKQAGILDVPVAIHLIKKDGNKRDFQYVMNGDIVLSDLK